MHFLRTSGGHLLTHDLLDPRLDAQAQRQPREDPRRLRPDVPGADEQFVARDLGLSRVFAERAEEEVRQTGDHERQA